MTSILLATADVAQQGFFANMIDPELLPIWICLLLSSCLFFLSGIYMFGRGFEGYQEQYLASSGESLEGLYMAIPAQHLMYLSFMLFLLLAMAFAALAGNLILGVFLGMPALFFPTILVMILRWHRTRTFEKQLPDALDNLKSSVQAGLSLPQSFEVLVQESPDPMRQEFRIVCQELVLGVQQPDTLDNMVLRMPIDDLRIAVNAINICTEQGGDLPGMLRVTALVIRDRLELSGKLRAITSQGKMQGMIVASIPFFLIWVVGMIDPEYMTPLLTTVWGWVMLGMIAVLDAIGYLWIRNIVNIEI